MRRSIFTAQHNEFRQIVRTLLVDRVVPDYEKWQEEGRPPRDFWRLAASAGILGIGVPAELGGLAGSTFRHSAIVSEESQRLGLALGGVRVHTDICMPYFLRFGTEEQKNRWIPRLTRGDAVVALALSEPGAGSDLKSMSTTARRDGDVYVVNGAKTFISNGAAADLVVLAVKTSPEAGRRGLKKLGLHAQDLAELAFSDMRVPVQNLLGTENEGFGLLTSNLAQERVSIAMSSQAAAVAAFEETERALSGERLGQVAKFELADRAAEIAAGQALIDRSILGVEDDTLTPADAATAKLYCTELQARVLDSCLRVLGPRHYRESSLVGRGYLDGRVTRIFGGSSEIMKVIIAQDRGW
jgi:acyl-CoA dehydrogenase